MTLAPHADRVVHAAAVLTVSPSGEIREANQAVHRMLGYAEGTLVGLSIAWLAPPSRHGLIELLHNARERSNPLCAESVFVREDGSLVSVDLTIQPRSGRAGQELSVCVELQEEDSRTVIRLPRQIEGAKPAQPAPTNPPARELRPTQPAIPPREARASKLPAPSARLSSLPPANVAPASLPPPRTSYIAPKPDSSVEVGEQLSACIQLLAWLDAHLDGADAEDAARQRARVRVVLQEATGLLEECRAELHRAELAARRSGPRRS